METTYTQSPNKVEIYTISHLNQEARLLLENGFPLIWIEGEISNLAKPASGHLYFSLKDAHAQVRCAMFRNRQLAFKLENGMHVLACAKVSLYEGRGDFQLIIEQLELAGDGALRLAFETLKQKLAQEGLFALERKRPLPKLPKTIGIITSPSGAAIRDILSVLKRRFAAIPIIIYPTAVQGNGASLQIVNAIQIANQRNECDVLILSRGGGSLEDLWCFNEEIVARAIYASAIPIITGVGHEIDFTIADFVADYRAPTPSVAAEMVSPDQRKWQHDLAILLQRLQQSTLNLLLKFNYHVTTFAKRLRHPGHRIQEQTQQLDHIEQRLCQGIKNFLHKKQAQLTELMRALDATSPLATLKRGYAIVTHEKTKEIIYRADELHIADKISIQLGKGSIKCVIENMHIES